MSYWIEDVNGMALALSAPSADIVDPLTITVALSRLPRFGGHFKREVEWYSVAQHSVYVSNLLPKELRLAGLLHDAHEALWGFGDLPTPVKRMDNYVRHFLKQHARTWDKAIAERFDIDPMLFNHPIVKDADLKILATEARDLMATGAENWLGIPEPLAGCKIEPHSIERAENEFYHLLTTLWKPKHLW